MLCCQIFRSLELATLERSKANHVVFNRVLRHFLSSSARGRAPVSCRCSPCI
ncbi:hypothetical protein IscW_ISCW014489 [Ixodes scapularis]|uniref:Uncharacterized protein n=1 Tax=Ixodes scapularis TaxID=6945 RepID=B7QHP6_IXOSC|nr:hypothetical protein IscW_ISCW014489 [Ixodes scapularis]|eukprot:XP_002414703.1 hypothetical protein IscW_ISCW014489 [Ixodes scapularis]